MKIIQDDLTGESIQQLLSEHLSDMHATSPPESVHALDIEKLKQKHITFWSAWQGTNLLGCAALAELNIEHAEIKSMRTTQLARQQGVASKLLNHLIDVAKARNYKRLSLETGSMKFFEPARRLYLKHGFEYCQPFANYVEDANSVFMTLACSSK